MQTQILPQIDNNFGRNYFIKSTQIISVVSTKGGVGKTTLTANLSPLLADLGFRVLMMDADVQPSLSKYFPLHKTAPNGIVEFLLGDNSDENIISCISKTIYPNLDIVLSNNITGDIQTKIQQRLDRSVLLKSKLSHPAITKQYDFVVIDTQGSVGALQDAACFAANLLLSPMVPTILSAREFVTGTIDMIERLSVGENIGLITPPLAGVIYAQDRTRDAKDIANEIRNYFNQFIDGKKRLLKTVVPNAKAYKEAASLRQPVHCHDRFQTNKTECAYDIMHDLVYEICPPIAERQLEAPCFVGGLLALENEHTLPETDNHQSNQDDNHLSGCLLSNSVASLNTVNEILENQELADFLYEKYEESIDFNRLNYPACFCANNTPIERIQVAIAYISTCCLNNPTIEKVQALLDEMVDLSIDSPFEHFIELCETANEKGEE